MPEAGAQVFEAAQDDGVRLEVLGLERRHKALGQENGVAGHRVGGLPGAMEDRPVREPRDVPQIILDHRKSCLNLVDGYSQINHLLKNRNTWITHLFLHG